MTKQEALQELKEARKRSQSYGAADANVFSEVLEIPLYELPDYDENGDLISGRESVTAADIIEDYILYYLTAQDEAHAVINQRLDDAETNIQNLHDSLDPVPPVGTHLPDLV